MVWARSPPKQRSDDRAYYRANFRKIIATREWLGRELTKLGFRVFPSQTNFMLVKPPLFAAQNWLQKLRDRKILVRWFKPPEVQDYLRITIGTPAGSVGARCKRRGRFCLGSAGVWLAVAKAGSNRRHAESARSQEPIAHVAPSPGPRGSRGRDAALPGRPGCRPLRRRAAHFPAPSRISPFCFPQASFLL